MPWRPGQAGGASKATSACRLPLSLLLLFGCCRLGGQGLPFRLLLPLRVLLARKALGVPANATYEAFYARWMESYEPLRGAYEAAVAARWDRVADAGVDVTAEYICVRAHDVRLMGLGERL